MSTSLLAAPLLLFAVGAAQAVSIDLVPVGNAGNTNDATGYGRVDQPYLIGKYEITNAQWRDFLTAKASVSDPYGLYNTNMAGLYGGIDRRWSVDHDVYTAKGGDANWDNRPVNYVSFWDAARFCNWLQNGQGSGDTETGAYINIGNQSTFARQSGAKYFIPTENEWYKAAYYDPGKPGGAGYWDYPTKSNAPPINTLLTPDPGNHANYWDYHGTGNGGYTMGGPYYSTVVGDFENSASPYGTFDQGGNLWEWNETAFDYSSRGMRGGDWFYRFDALARTRYYYYDPVYEGHDVGDVGFRVASVPEPGSITLIVSGAIAGLIWWRRRR